jgi:hypothetical protein
LRRPVCRIAVRIGVHSSIHIGRVAGRCSGRVNCSVRGAIRGRLSGGGVRPRVIVHSASTGVVSNRKVLLILSRGESGNSKQDDTSREMRFHAGLQSDVLDSKMPQSHVTAARINAPFQQVVTLPFRHASLFAPAVTLCMRRPLHSTTPTMPSEYRE